MRSRSQWLIADRAQSGPLPVLWDWTSIGILQRRTTLANIQRKLNIEDNPWVNRLLHFLLAGLKRLGQKLWQPSLMEFSSPFDTTGERRRTTPISIKRRIEGSAGFAAITGWWRSTAWLMHSLSGKCKLVDDWIIERVRTDDFSAQIDSTCGFNKWMWVQ